jgi:hypothetical protein
VLQRARDEGPGALEKLIETVEKSSKYGQDLKLTLGDNLIERYIETLDDETMTP